MAKNSIPDFSATAASNTDIQSVNIDENCPASGINNAIRELMVDLKNMDTGAVALTSPQFTTASFTGGFTATAASTITTADNTAQLTLKSTDADAGVGPVLELVRDSGSPADSDLLGTINFIADDDAGNASTFASISTQIGDASNGTESCGLQIKAMSGGSLVSRADFLVSETVFNNGSIDLDFRVESNGDANLLKVDAGNDVLGIGTASPSSTFKTSIKGDYSSIIGGIEFDSGGGDKFTVGHASATSPSGKINVVGAGNLIFATNNSEAARFDSSGNFLVGKTSSGSFTQSSVELNNTGYVMCQRDDGAQLFLSRGGTTTTGAQIALYNGNTQQGTIGNKVGRMYLGSGNTGLIFEGYFDDSVIPFSPDDQNIRDNAIDLGYASSRFDDIYASNTSIIGTSDQNEKQDIASLTSAEITAAKAISKLFKTFKWKTAVAEKGDAARIHTGHVAQEVQSAMSDAGLDATKYAFWCSNTWWEAEETITNDDGEKHTGVMSYRTAEDAPKGATKRTRLGIRYPELLAFVGAATEQRLGDIENRIAALEA